MSFASESTKCDGIELKDIPDTANDDVCTVAMLWVTITSVLCPVQKVTVCTGHYYYVRAGLHVPYKSELIIT